MDEDLEAIASELLEIVDTLYRATERTLALLHRVRDRQSNEGKVVPIR